MKNIYMDSIKYGEKLLNQRKPVTFNKLREHLQHQGYEFKTDEQKRMLDYIRRETFIIFDTHAPSGDEPSILSRESYFNLLDYKELQAALAASKEARKYSIIAIFLSFVALLASVILSLIEINQPVQLENQQFQTIQNTLERIPKEIKQ